MKQTISLYELNAQLRGAVEDSFPDALWVTGELSEARQASNGHFYGELIEKDAEGRNVVARARINCWARVFNLLHMRFQHETGQMLRAGISVLLRVQVTFHEAYGLALNVLDIDSSYTMGSLVRRRREILNQLEADGILHDNQELALPTLTQRIAVISAPTAAGYGDFCHHLQHNEYHLRFDVRLFPAVMQGQHVEESVLAALAAIADEEEPWDVVVIIRGGGATADLSDFDSYPLAACIAQYPLPVIVGIGHERDETVLDFVAHQRVKTPTAAADFLIDHQLTQLLALAKYSTRIQEAVNATVRNQQLRLQRIAYRFPAAVGQCTLSSHHRIEVLCRRIDSAIRSNLQQAAHRVERLAERLPVAASRTLEQESHRLTLLAQKVALADPERILRQGYSLTTVNGHVVTDASQVRPGDEIHTRLAQGELISVCQEPNP